MDPEVHKERSRRIQEIQQRKQDNATELKGLLIVNTGAGKGKTSAAMGMGLRIAGHGKRLAEVQFLNRNRPRNEEYWRRYQVWNGT